MNTRPEIPPEWEKENIRLYTKEAADREFARVAAECSSDSDLLRQAIRYTEQFVDEIRRGQRLVILRTDGSETEVSPDLCKDGSLEGSPTIRRSLVLHQSSRPRLDFLAKELQLEDVSAVARFALRFFSRLAGEIASGSRFFVVSASGKRQEVKFGTFSIASRLTDNAGGEEESVPLPRPPVGVALFPTRPAPSGASVIPALKVGFGRT